MTDPRPQDLDVLAESNRLLTSTLDLTEVLDRLADMTRTRLDTDVARIWLLDEAGEMLRLSVHKGRIRSPLPAKEQVATQSSLVSWVFTHRSPLVLTDVQQDPRLENRAWFAAEGFASLLCVPIVLDAGVIGILSCMTRTRREFTPAEVALAEALTASAAVAVRNARVYAEALRRLAEIQALQRVASDTLSSPDLVTALNAVVREIQALLRSDGVAVAYGLVSSHRGQISLDGGPGKGTTVTFWLPTTGRAEPAPPAAAPAEAERRGRILAVDDEADVREVLADVLTSRGHTVTLAGGGREALRCFAARAPLPVLLLTGWADAVDSAAGRVDAVIKKPFDMTKLAAAVSAALAGPPSA
jgi:CheY-like chemotaxis protein/K+-sensing histidine kinase KdpD